MHLAYSIVCSLRILSIYLSKSKGDLSNNTNVLIGGTYDHTTLNMIFLVPEKGLFVALKAESPSSSIRTEKHVCGISHEAILNELGDLVLA